ncbi:hypothetical protein QOT17_024907 [Balamuthia mandrillaris]
MNPAHSKESYKSRGHTLYEGLANSSEDLHSVFRPLSQEGRLQKSFWSLLYCTAANLSSDQMAQFIVMMKTVALLLPDVNARRRFLETMDSDLVELQNSDEALLWLWRLQQKMNAHLSQPYLFLGKKNLDKLPTNELLPVLRNKWEWKSEDSEEVERTLANEAEEAGGLINQMIPDELMLSILDQLSPAELLISCGVCRRWRRLASDAVLWKPRFLQRWVIIRPHILEIALISESWKDLFFQWRSWDLLDQLFAERDCPANLTFESKGEEYVEEEAEVVFLSEKIKEVEDTSGNGGNGGGSSGSGTGGGRGKTPQRVASFRERRKTRKRRRWRLSLELAGVMNTNVQQRKQGSVFLVPRDEPDEFEATPASAASAISSDPASPRQNASSSSVTSSSPSSSSNNIIVNNTFLVGSSSMCTEEGTIEKEIGGWGEGWLGGRRRQFVALPKLKYLVPPPINPKAMNVLLMLSEEEELRLFMEERERRKVREQQMLEKGKEKGEDGGLEEEEQPAAPSMSELSPNSIKRKQLMPPKNIRNRPNYVYGLYKPPKLPVWSSGGTQSRRRASHIKTATLTKLLEYLTSPWEHDSPESLKEWQNTICSPIQLRVINVIKMWTESYYADFVADPYLSKCLERFAKKVLSKGIARQVLRLQERHGPRPSPTYQFSTVPPYPEVPKNLFSPKLSIWDVSDLEIARQLTIIEFNHFSKIKPREFVYRTWRRAAAQKAPNIFKSLAHFKQTAKWVETEISKCSKLRSRVKKVKRFICISNMLLTLNNFNTLMAVLHGLNQWARMASSTHRLYSMVLKFSDIWGELSKRDRKDFENMEKLMINSELYQETLVHSAGTGPRIPYLYIMNVERYIPSIQEDNTINFTKSKYLYSLISQLMSYQETPYNLETVGKIADLLHGLITRNSS